jgi:CO/xanthine dehydrogenase Mo-binding subunit
MDPWEVRLLNAYRNGDMRPYQKIAEDATLIEVIKGAAELVGHELPGNFRAMNSWDRQGTPSAPVIREKI